MQHSETSEIFRLRLTRTPPPVGQSAAAACAHTPGDPIQRRLCWFMEKRWKKSRNSVGLRVRTHFYGQCVQLFAS